MSVPEVCSHGIVCVKYSVAPVAAGEEGAADVGGCSLCSWTDAHQHQHRFC